MEKGTRELNIKRIINMEDRICQCKRCPALIRCMRKPSLGKGDLEPQALLVFESDNGITRDMDKVVEIRDMIKKALNTDRVYHTFLVRCQPKACPSQQNSDCYMQTKMLNKDYVCLLTNQQCDGIPIKPSNEQIMNCLPFLLEEIDVLKPAWVVLFGSRVGEYILKSSGLYDPVQTGALFQYQGINYFTTVDERMFNEDHARIINGLSAQVD